MCRACNRWLADYCRPYPDRLFGAAMLPMQSVDFSIPARKSPPLLLGPTQGFTNIAEALRRALDRLNHLESRADHDRRSFKNSVHSRHQAHLPIRVIF
jgi:hypothetical protein